MQRNLRLGVKIKFVIMTIVNVYKKDETVVQITSEDSGVIMEIAEFFTFMIEGAKFHPLVKSKQWDGKISLMNKRNQTLPYGLLSKLGEFCKSRDYDIVIDKEITNRKPQSVSELKEYINQLTISTRGQKIEPRDYQFDAFQHGIREGRAVLISPTASGKSLIIYMMLRWFLDQSEKNRNPMALVIVPTTALVSQMKGDFKDYSEFDNSFDAESQIHEIYSGKEKKNFTAD